MITADHGGFGFLRRGVAAEPGARSAASAWRLDPAPAAACEDAPGARWFDAATYVALHEDLRALALADPEFDPRHHFAESGRSEGRAPSFLFQPHHVRRWFATHERRQVEAKDLLAAFEAVPAQDRFVPNRWFNARALRARYAERLPALAQAGDYEAFELYVEHCAEHPLSPNGLFDEEGYRARYPDVAEAVRAGAFRSGFHHFLIYGACEKRTNLPGWGRRPEGAAAGASVAPRSERDMLLDGPSGLDLDLWWFDEGFYLTLYPDAHARKRSGAVLSGLEHFLLEGHAEGRVPNPSGAGSRADQNPWSCFAALDEAAPDLPDTRVTADAACALRDRLAAEGADRAAATDAIWPFVRSPDIAARFDPECYLALNPDVEKAVADGRAGSAESHWRHDGLREQRLAPRTNLFPRRRIARSDFGGWTRGVNLFGPVSSVSGLGQASRSYLAALRAAGVPTDVHDVSGLVRAGAPLDLIGPGGLRHSTNLFMLNPEQITSFADRYGTEIFDRRANVGFWVWELAAPRPEWKTILSGFDLLVAPGAFCRAAFASFTDLPVATAPYAIDRTALRARAEQADPSNAWLGLLRAARREGRHVVLFIMDASSYTARKGVDVFLALAARFAALMPGRCVFCLKTHSADVSGFDGVAAHAPVTVIDEVLSDADLAALKSLASVYVSPHRSEGFGLNVLESILLGVPALCSRHGGGTDLLEPDYPYFIEGRLKEIGRDMGPYRRGAVWFEPDVEQAAALLARMLDAPPEPSFARIASRLSARLSPDAVGAGLRAILAEHCAIGEDPAQARAAFERLAAPRPEEAFEIGPAGAGPGTVSDRVGACLAPFCTVVTSVGDATADEVLALHADIAAQSLPSWEWCAACPDSNLAALDALRAIRRADARVKILVHPGGAPEDAALNGAAALGIGEALVFTGPGARLDSRLLRVFADRMRGSDRTTALYCDEAPAEEFWPSVKPDWSPELALSRAYVREGLCIRKSRFLELGGVGAGMGRIAAHDLLLRASEGSRARGGGRIGHVDQVLVRAAPVRAAGSGEEARASMEHLHRLGVEASIEPGLLPGTCRVRPRVRAERADVNILTAGTVNPLTGRTYIYGLVRSLLAHPGAPAADIRIVADAQADCAELEDLHGSVRVVRFDRAGAAFNFSEKANFAVRSSAPGPVVLMNDDMEALDGQWLGALLEMLELPGVGVVGGRLLHPSGAVQHSGISLGVLGAAAHVFGGLPDAVVGSGGHTHVIRNYAAVTGALMAFDRSTFDSVGGFDPVFPIDYNDVDFCLRTIKAGLRVVCTPYARMIHFESASAPRIAADALDERRFRARWGAMIARDPYYNVNLRRDSVLHQLR